MKYLDVLEALQKVLEKARDAQKADSKTFSERLVDVQHTTPISLDIEIKLGKGAFSGCAVLSMTTSGPMDSREADFRPYPTEELLKKLAENSNKKIAHNIDVKSVILTKHEHTEEKTKSYRVSLTFNNPTNTLSDFKDAIHQLIQDVQTGLPSARAACATR